MIKYEKSIILEDLINGVVKTHEDEKLKDYLIEIGVLKVNYESSITEYFENMKKTEEIYEFLKENGIEKNYREHKDLILINFGGTNE